MTELEPVRGETIAAIHKALNLKLDHPDVVRLDPDSGYFILGDTEIAITRHTLGAEILMLEKFPEAPEGKPSNLAYSYQLENGVLKLDMDEDSEHAPLATARLEALKASGIPATSEFRDSLSFIPSELLAQSVLSSISEMKILIR